MAKIDFQRIKNYLEYLVGGRSKTTMRLRHHNLLFSLYFLFYSGLLVGYFRWGCFITKIFLLSEENTLIMPFDENRLEPCFLTKILNGMQILPSFSIITRLFLFSHKSYIHHIVQCKNNPTHWKKKNCFVKEKTSLLWECVFFSTKGLSCCCRYADGNLCPWGIIPDDGGSEEWQDPL